MNAGASAGTSRKGMGWLTTAIQAGSRGCYAWRGTFDPRFVSRRSMALMYESFLVEHRVSGILWDVDGTLTPNKATVVTSAARERTGRSLSRRVPQAIFYRIATIAV